MPVGTVSDRYGLLAYTVLGVSPFLSERTRVNSYRATLRLPGRVGHRMLTIPRRRTQVARMQADRAVTEL